MTQRGTGFAGQSYFTSDRWGVNTETSSHQRIETRGTRSTAPAAALPTGLWLNINLPEHPVVWSVLTLVVITSSLYNVVRNVMDAQRSSLMDYVDISFDSSLVSDQIMLRVIVLTLR